ncbi:MAG: IS4 family transposase [Planctomycetota bacterium]
MRCFAKKTRTPPSDPPRMRDAIRMVAALGGFLGRKSDGEPGTETVWRGLERLMDFTIAFRMFVSSA